MLFQNFSLNQNWNLQLQLHTSISFIILVSFRFDLLFHFKNVFILVSSVVINLKINHETH